MAKAVSENELRAREALMLAAKRFDTHSGTSVSEHLVDAIDALIDVKVSERLAAFANQLSSSLTSPRGSEVAIRRAKSMMRCPSISATENQQLLRLIRADDADRRSPQPPGRKGSQR